jgi:ketosteroid isomerase-like protein
MVRITRFFAGFSLFFLPYCIVLAQSPALAPAPAASPSAVTSTESPEIHEFQKIEDDWSEAINQRDQYGLELVLSSLFVDVSAAGDITTRNQQLAQLITLEDKTLHIEQRVITVRMLGDIAVANGTYVLHHKAGSAPVDEKGVFTHVFERARNGWLCINSQRTVLREDPSGKNAKPKKPSSPGLSFLNSLFNKSNKAASNTTSTSSTTSTSGTAAK